MCDAWLGQTLYKKGLVFNDRDVTGPSVKFSTVCCSDQVVFRWVLKYLYLCICRQSMWIQAFLCSACSQQIVGGCSIRSIGPAIIATYNKTELSVFTVLTYMFFIKWSLSGCMCVRLKYSAEHTYLSSLAYIDTPDPTIDMYRTIQKVNTPHWLKFISEEQRTSSST